MNHLLLSLKLTFHRLRNQLWLLILLGLITLLLPLGAAQTGETLLSSSAFRPIQMGIAGAEGEDASTRQLVSLLTANIGKDGYCHVEVMTQQEGEAALHRGEISALLILPEGFLNSVLTGENRPVTLITDRSQPLESYLIRWLGTSAARMLASAQAGIYAAADAYRQSELPSEELDALIWDINLNYLSWTTGRSRMYHLTPLTPTGGSLELGLHYGISVLTWLPLLAAALVYPAFGGSDLLPWYRRLRSIGFPGLWGGLGAVLASALFLLPMVLLPLCLIHGGWSWQLLRSGLLCAWFSAAFCGIWCQGTGSPGGAALWGFVVSLVLLFWGGGILPQMMMPPALASLTHLSPMAWLRSVCADALGCEGSLWMTASLLILSLFLTLLNGLLFDRRITREVSGL